MRRVSFDTPRRNSYTFDLNLYQHKKTLAEGLIILALFSANCNHLRYMLEIKDQGRSGFFYASLSLILLSLAFQGLFGIGLAWNGRYNVQNEPDHRLANISNNITLIIAFVIALINLFISAFGTPFGKPPLVVKAFQLESISLQLETIVGNTTINNIRGLLAKS